MSCCELGVGWVGGRRFTSAVGAGPGAALSLLLVLLLLVGVCSCGWVGGWMGWIEENEAVRMSCCELGVGWAGGWETYLGRRCRARRRLVLAACRPPPLAC